MIVEQTVESTRAALERWRRDRLSIALVPTMGFFHEGHLALMKTGRELCDKVVVSLFVNPTQFSPHEDLAAYPRDMAGDCRKAERAGVDLLFCPGADRMYHPGHQTTVHVEQLSRGLCGKDRPGHFQGVATIVSKLFNLIQPDYAVFGEKDFQQLAVIRQMVADLDFPVHIIGHPIVRERDGVAMSSRNAYLNDEQRKSARVLYQALKDCRDMVLRSTGNIAVSLLSERAAALIAGEPSCSLDYFTIVEERTLAVCDVVKDRCRAMAAMKVSGKVRLIDNIPLYEQ